VGSTRPAAEARSESSPADIVARLHGQGWLRFARDPSDGRRKTLMPARRGWVARTRDPADARRRLLGLTDSAREDLPRLTPAVRRVQDRMTEPLVEAQRELSCAAAGRWPTRMARSGRGP
jgi:DNA-binding MarR family transcriptional regulator